MEPLDLFGQYSNVYRPLVAEINNVLADYRLFNAQWAILKLLLAEKAMTPAEIATRQQVEKPSVTKVLQRLDELGLIEVKPGEDKREKWIYLSDTGMAQCREIKEKLSTLYEGLLAGISEKEIAITTSVLEQIYKNLQTERVK